MVASSQLKQPLRGAMSDPKTILVDSSRLKYDRGDGEHGDIWKSMSIHLIPEGKITSPFQSNGMLLSACSSKTDEAGKLYTPAYRLVTVKEFPREATTYREKVLLTMPDEWYTGDNEANRFRAGDYARNDPNGFYDAMTVNQGSNTFVMMGPPVRFYGIESAVQQSLF